MSYSDEEKDPVYGCIYLIVVAIGCVVLAAFSAIIISEKDKNKQYDTNQTFQKEGKEKI